MVEHDLRDLSPQQRSSAHLLSQVPYKPLAPRDITLPERQPAGGYVEPDLPLRHIPAPF